MENSKRRGFRLTHRKARLSLRIMVVHKSQPARQCIRGNSELQVYKFDRITEIVKKKVRERSLQMRLCKQIILGLYSFPMKNVFHTHNLCMKYKIYDRSELKFICQVILLVNTYFIKSYYRIFFVIKFCKWKLRSFVTYEVKQVIQTDERNTFCLMNTLFILALLFSKRVLR